VGSTKAELTNWVQSMGFSGTYVGGHPMTGAEKSGLKAANPLLYENAVYILTGINQANRSLAEERLIPILQALKSRVMFLPPEEHDRILAAISHLPQLAAIALINMVGQRNSEQQPYFELAAGGFRDLTRIASSSIDIWQDIIASNKENVASALRAFITILEDELAHLGDLRDNFEKANAFRSLVPKQNKGFLSPLSDILVYVTDEMGVVAKIANALSAEQVDIRDIELLKIREKEGGVFRLSLSGEAEAQTAIKILNSIGYKAFIRE
jgi:prephenate dehydrogenase